MAANLEDQLIDKVRALPPNKQQEALRLLDTLASGATSEPNETAGDRRPIWEVVDEINDGTAALQVELVKLISLAVSLASVVHQMDMHVVRLRDRT